MAMTKKEQMELEVAQMRVREMEAQIAVLFGNTPTNTFISRITSGGQFKDYPLLPDGDIKFVLPGLGNIIQARIRDGWLEIMGNNRIEISPKAVNTVQIRCKE